MSRDARVSPCSARRWARGRDERGLGDGTDEHRADRDAELGAGQQRSHLLGRLQDDPRPVAARGDHRFEATAPRCHRGELGAHEEGIGQSRTIVTRRRASLATHPIGPGITGRASGAADRPLPPLHVLHPPGPALVHDPVTHPGTRPGLSTNPRFCLCGRAVGHVGALARLRTRRVATGRASPNCRRRARGRSSAPVVLRRHVADDPRRRPRASPRQMFRRTCRPRWPVGRSRAVDEGVIEPDRLGHQRGLAFASAETGSSPRRSWHRDRLLDVDDAVDVIPVLTQHGGGSGPVDRARGNHIGCCRGAVHCRGQPRGRDVRAVWTRKPMDAAGNWQWPGTRHVTGLSEASSAGMRAADLPGLTPPTCRAVGRSR